jgi:hypothetical protein
MKRREQLSRQVIAEGLANEAFRVIPGRQLYLHQQGMALVRDAPLLRH